jgi:hypothetical protein
MAGAGAAAVFRFQLPLSGSHAGGQPARARLRGRSEAFNSLSRDHPKNVGVFPGVTTQNFQLSLSGSLYAERVQARESTIAFQLPLSGSLDGLGSEGDRAPNGPFNSLSRDHTFGALTPGTPPTAFNSLSRDHALAPGLGSALNAVKTGFVFQLPLSGSPSPSPGFSGFPRRFAAALLRTNKF